MADDFDLLVRETLTLKPALTGGNPFTTSGGKTRPALEEVPRGPGILYCLKSNEKSFCVQCRPVPHMRKALENFKNNPESSPLFSLIPPEEKEVLMGKKKEDLFSSGLWPFSFFSTDYRELAEVICEKVRYCRFPYNEEEVFVISDPGLSWWMEEKDDCLLIHFGSYGIGDSQTLRKLGPMGDSSTAERRFQSLYELVNKEKYCTFSEFSCDSKGLRLVFMDEEKKELFKNFFLQGNEDGAFFHFLENKGSITLFLYLKELAGTRQFWREVEGRSDGKAIKGSY